MTTYRAISAGNIEFKSDLDVLFPFMVLSSVVPMVHTRVYQTLPGLCTGGPHEEPQQRISLD
jgi:hypothetical protein